MKKSYLILITAFIAVSSFAQQNTGSILNSGGSSLSNGNTSMIISIGEPIAGMIQTTSTALSQGFLIGSKTIVATAATGIEDILTENATVYPNPFSNHINITVEEKDMTIELLNMLGQTVYTGVYTTGGIDLPEIHTGIYILHATANQKVIINSKLLKQ